MESHAAHYRRRISHCRFRLSREEESELARLTCLGDDAAFQQLVESQLPFVMKLAHHIHDRSCVAHGISIPVEELVAQANLDLLAIVRKFDPSRGARLATYVALLMKRSLRRYIFQHQSVIVRPMNRTKISERNRSHANRAGTALSFDSPVHVRNGQHGDRECDAYYSICENVNTIEAVDHRLDRPHLLVRMHDEISRLPNRERTIILRRWFQGETLKEVSHMLGITSERVRQLESAALVKLKESLVDCAELV